MAQKMALINIVKTKIDFVRSQTDELHGLLDALINKETADAAAAVDSDKQDLRKVREINSRLDTVLDFLLEKCAEIDNFTSGSVVDFQQQHVKTSVPSSSSSSDNPQLFDRIEAVELAVSTFDQRMSELAQTKNQLEIRFNIMEETLEKLLTETANKEKAQSSTKGISEKKRKIHKNLGSSETERLEGIEAQVLYLLASKSDLSERLDSRIFPLKDLIKQIESELTGIKNSLQNKEQESLLLQKTNKDLTSDLDTLKNQCDQTVISLTDLSSKMDATEFTVNGSVACRINEENQIRELQDRISMVEEHKSKDMNYYTGKLEEVESLYKQLCQMVASKVNPLRHLQDILNKYHRTMEMQEETALQTKAVTADITDSSPGAGCLGPLVWTSHREFSFSLASDYGYGTEEPSHLQNPDHKMAEGGPPDLATQKKIIEEHLGRNMKKGESWYLVDLKWFKQWKEYVGYDQRGSYCQGDQAVHPGPIDSGSLFKPDSSSLFKPDSNVLRNHLIDNLDYVLLPAEAYKKLASWYGEAPGQEPVIRKVIEHGMFVKHCKVEVYLMELKLCENSDLNTVITRAFSRSDTVATIEQEMRKLFNIPNDKDVRLWNRYNTFGHLMKKDITLHNAGLCQGQVIVIEVKNDDGTWPKQNKRGYIGANASSNNDSSNQSAGL